MYLACRQLLKGRLMSATKDLFDTAVEAIRQSDQDLNEPGEAHLKGVVLRLSGEGRLSVHGSSDGGIPGDEAARVLAAQIRKALA